MKKVEFIDAVAKRAEFTKKDTKEILDVMLDVITETLASGEDVNFPGFGKFKVTEVAEKECRNPQTGEKVLTPAHKKPSFTVGKALKTAVR